MKDDTSQRRITEQGAALPHPESPSPLVSSAPRSGEPSSTSLKPPSHGEGEERPNDLCWKCAESVHNYVREFIRIADQKAAFFFAIATALLAFLYNQKLANKWVMPPVEWRLPEILSFFATWGLVISAAACMFTVYPRTPGSKRGIVFFQAIAEFESAQEYVRDVLAKSSAQLVSAKLTHVHVLAKVCSRKYGILRVAIWAGAIGVLASFLLLLTNNYNGDLVPSDSPSPARQERRR